jgi:uncharacterized protein YbjT (DUF2867 family)
MNRNVGDRMIFVVGATGTVGRRVIDGLLERWTASMRYSWCGRS